MNILEEIIEINKKIKIDIKLIYYEYYYEY